MHSVQLLRLFAATQCRNGYSSQFPPTGAKGNAELAYALHLSVCSFHSQIFHVCFRSLKINATNRCRQQNVLVLAIRSLSATIQYVLPKKLDFSIYFFVCLFFFFSQMENLVCFLFRKFVAFLHFTASVIKIVYTACFFAFITNCVYSIVA